MILVDQVFNKLFLRKPKAIKRYYGATEGQHLIRSIKWYANTGTNCGGKCGGVTCDICVKTSSTFRAENVGGPCGGVIRLASDDLDVSGHILAHEWGHRYFCVSDEYDDDDNCQQCGHSLMNGPVGISLYNMCIDNGPTFHDHGEDPSEVPCGIVLANGSWQHAPAGANLVMIPSRTPDVFNYEIHDFNNFVYNW